MKGGNMNNFLQRLSYKVLYSLLVFLVVLAGFIALFYYFSNQEFKAETGGIVDMEDMTDYSGGVSSEVAIVPTSNFSWNKYASGTNITFTSKNSFKLTDPTIPGEFIGSIYYLNDGRQFYWTQLYYGGEGRYATSFFRYGTSPETLSGWSGTNNVINAKAIQVKIVISPTSEYITSLDQIINLRYYSFFGSIKDSVTGLGINDVQISISGESKTTTSVECATKSSDSRPAGCWYLYFPYNETSSNVFTFNFSKSGYVTATKNFTITSGSDEIINVSLQPNGSPSSTPSASSSTSTTTKPKSTTSSNKLSTSDPTVAPITTSAGTKPVALQYINGQAIAVNESTGEPIIPGEIKYKQPITLSGTTTPSTKIRLYIYSDPITVETTADSAGNWSYTYADTLELGLHRVEATVVDPNGVEGEKVLIAVFNVAQASTDATTTTTTTKDATWFIISESIILFFALIILGLVFAKKRIDKKLGQTSLNH